MTLLFQRSQLYNIPGFLQAASPSEDWPVAARGHRILVEGEQVAFQFIHAPAGRREGQCPNGKHRRRKCYCMGIWTDRTVIWISSLSKLALSILPAASSTI